MGDIKRGAERILTEKVFLDAIEGISGGGVTEELDMRGLAANRPAANKVAIGTTYWSVDTGDIRVSDGTDWKVI